MDKRQMPAVSIVAERSYEPEAVYRAVRRAVDILGGMDRFVPLGARVLLKPNLLRGASPEKAVNTHPSVVRAAVRLVREAGGVPHIGDSPALQSFGAAAAGCGLKDLADEMGVPLLPLVDSIEVKNDRPGSVFRRVELAREAWEADVIINLPKVKTHQQMMLTLAVKNMFGCVVGLRKAQWHMRAGVERGRFARMLVELSRLLSPALTIVDGIVAMEGEGGPGSGDPVSVGVLVAGEEPAAVDRTLARLLGAPEAAVPTLVASTDDRGDHRVVGERIEDVAIGRFTLPSLVDVTFGPRTIRRHLRDWSTSRPAPLRTVCSLCMDCQLVCPAGAIRQENGRIVICYDECIRCYCCQEVCPQGAMGVSRGWLLRLAGRHSHG